MVEVSKDVPKEAPKAKPRPEFSHPALKMIGIPRIRLPSRNWSIFFTVTGLFFGGLYYDREHGRKIRDEYKKQVEFLSEKPISGLELPRKVTVYMTPPPSDTIEITQKHWRQNVKPLLTAASIDYEIVDEDKQGQIRSTVAEGIRNKRRAAIGLATSGYQPDDLDHKINDKLIRDPLGGIICLGRGAYKEYMAGLQEGWMGPLQEPEFVKEEKLKAEADRRLAEEKKIEENPDYEPPKEEPKQTVEPAWLKAPQYVDAQVDPAFYQTEHEPILVVRNPHILGFLRTPQRFGRYMTKRFYVDECAKNTKALILEQTRPIHPADVDLEAVEEQDWPRKWKQQGMDKDSEWMREFKLDDRILSKLSVYDPAAPATIVAPTAVPVGVDTPSSGEM